jgi:hypothetical protein
MEKILFQEEQRWDQLWLKIPLYVLALGNVILFGYGIYFQIILRKPWGDNPMPDTVLIIVTCFTFAIWGGLLFLFERSKLITCIDMQEIRLRFPPFFSKEKIIPVETIEKMVVRKYNPIMEYGGWGIRLGWKGRAYNVRGNFGLQLYFKNGKRLLVGTQKPEQVKWAIKKISTREDDNQGSI